jgi:hypothetical protein
VSTARTFIYFVSMMFAGLCSYQLASFINYKQRFEEVCALNHVSKIPDDPALQIVVRSTDGISSCAYTNCEFDILKIGFKSVYTKKLIYEGTELSRLFPNAVGSYANLVFYRKSPDRFCHKFKLYFVINDEYCVAEYSVIPENSYYLSLFVPSLLISGYPGIRVGQRFSLQDENGQYVSEYNHYWLCCYGISAWANDLLFGPLTNGTVWSRKVGECGLDKGKPTTEKNNRSSRALDYYFITQLMEAQK